MKLAALPPVDVIVISHDHYDHLDYPTIRALARQQVPFVTSLGVGAHLEAWGVAPQRITELDWWQTHPAARHRADGITAAPSCSISRAAAEGPQCHAVVLDGHAGAAPSVFFSGDTGLTTEYATIRERLGPFDLAMLEVGAFHPELGRHPPRPGERTEGAGAAGPAPFLPVHWGTFALAMHDWDGPPRPCWPAPWRPAGRAAADAAPGRAGRAGARRKADAMVARRRRAVEVAACGIAGTAAMTLPVAAWPLD